ncbi:MAG: sulfur carrier protein ThiS [Muribaculum sp.]|nr:sulfur carrier protein ThiS [Muribaculum sp.]
MKVYINNETLQLPAQILTVENLMKWKQIPEQGTAIAVNDKLVMKRNWSATLLHEDDRITVITAAFGG